MMAAGRRRKHLSGDSNGSCSSWKQYKIKRKKLEPLPNGLNTKRHVSLEWDGNQNEVVAKKEQIGISSRHLRPFNGSSMHDRRNVLGDVLSVPDEIFDLEALTYVLSYEVWQTHLSEEERIFLMRFLPTRTDKEEVLLALLRGDNFHFGNSLLEWGTSVCSGNLHPDMVVQQEKRLKEEKKLYFSELQRYHDDMIRYLQKMKKRWESCKDTEEAILQKMWRLRSADQCISSRVNESRFDDSKEDATATSESCSWIADEKDCSTDDQNSFVLKSGEKHKRISVRCFVKGKGGSAFIGSDDVPNVEARSIRSNKVTKRNIHENDGSNYMSYIKITKKQYELIKNMRQSGKTIQSRSLNRVLGNLDNLHVQPYEHFMEEETRKLHEHWLRLARKDLPVAYANLKDLQLLKREFTKLIDKEMEKKRNSVLEDGVLDNSENLQDQKEDSAGINLRVYDEDDKPNAVFHDQNVKYMRTSESILQHGEYGSGSPENESRLQHGEYGSGSPENESMQQILSLNSLHTSHLVEMGAGDNQSASKADNAASNTSHYSGNLHISEAATAHQVAHFCSGQDLWPPDRMPNSRHDSTAGNGYTCTSALALSCQQVNEALEAQLTNLDTGLPEGDTRLHGHLNDGSFSSSPIQDRTKRLQSIYKNEEVFSYHNELKEKGLTLLPTGTELSGNGQFAGHFQKQMHPSLPLGGGQRWQADVFTQQNMAQSFHSNGSSYIIPSQEFPPYNNIQNWSANPIHLSAPYQHQLHDGEPLNASWFSTRDHLYRSRLSTSDGISVPSQNIVSGSNSDQSLYGVLSRCSPLRLGNPYDARGSTEHFALPSDYGVMGNNLNMPQAPYPIGYLGGLDSTTSMMPNGIGWMNTHNQNSTIHDSLEKPYLRSWNQ